MNGRTQIALTDTLSDDAVVMRALNILQTKAQEHLTRERVGGPSALAEWLRLQIGWRDREVMLAVFLTSDWRIKGVEPIAVGSVGITAVNNRELFRAALAHNATFIVLAHNHPDTDSITPSDADLAATGLIMEIAERLEMQVIDHMIVTPEGVYSMSEKRDLERISNAYQERNRVVAEHARVNAFKDKLNSLLELIEERR